MTDINAAVREIAEFQRTKHTELHKVLDELGQKQREMADRLVHIEQKSTQQGERGLDGAGQSVLKSFLASNGFQAVQSGAPSTGRNALSTSIRQLRKALTSDGASNNYGVQAQRDPNLWNDPRRTLNLFDVLPTVPVSSNAYEYVQLNAFSHAANYQAAEGDTKAEQNVDTATVTAPIKTIAAWVRASRQVLGDVRLLEQQLGSLLTYGCLKKLEAEVIAGTGTAGAMTGLVTAGAALTTLGAPADRISSGAMQLTANGWNPDLVILNTTDWHTIRTDRDTNDGYVAGGWNQPTAPNIWGLPVVVTPSLVANTALVIDTSQVAVLERERPLVQVSNSDDQNFTKNLVTLLAELRAGLAIYATGAVGKVTLS